MSSQKELPSGDRLPGVEARPPRLSHLDKGDVERGGTELALHTILVLNLGSVYFQLCYLEQVTFLS